MCRMASAGPSGSNATYLGKHHVQVSLDKASEGHFVKGTYTWIITSARTPLHASGRPGSDRYANISAKGSIWRACINTTTRTTWQVRCVRAPAVPEPIKRRTSLFGSARRPLLRSTSRRSDATKNSLKVSSNSRDPAGPPACTTQTARVMRRQSPPGSTGAPTWPPLPVHHPDSSTHAPEPFLAALS